MKSGIAVLMVIQLVWIGAVTPCSENCINYDPDFDDAAGYWNYSTWHPSPNPVDYWMKAENGIVTLFYKGNQSDWGNTEVYQRKKPASKIVKSLRLQDFGYKEDSGNLWLFTKVKRDIDPVWQGYSLNLNKSQYPQANIGVYLWFEVKGWNYDDWTNRSSLVIDIYFDSRHQDLTTNDTIVWEVGESYPPMSTPYDKQIHAGYVVKTLPLNTWQEFDVDISAYIDRTLRICRNKGINFPSNELVLKFFGVYVDSFSAALQASFDYVRLENVELPTFPIAAIAFIAITAVVITVILVVRRRPY